MKNDDHTFARSDRCGHLYVEKNTDHLPTSL
jgi:hypothetical protein